MGVLVETDLAAMMHARLTEQRRVMVSGAIDANAVSMLCAQLMTLDGVATDPVDVLISSPGGPLDQIFAVLDVIGLMRASVDITAIGAVAGTAVALVACGSGRRRAAPHATFNLRLGPQRSTVSGTADAIAQQAEESALQRSRYVDLLVAATGNEAAVITEQLDAGERLSVEEAIALCLVDSVFDRSTPTNPEQGMTS